jgi:hypothetical protein
MEQFDVAVIGAGLAGLSAAHMLGSKNGRVLLLESSNRLGGKVNTCHHENIVYERGALFAFDPAWAPFPIDGGELQREDFPIGVFLRNQLFTGDSVPACLQAVGLTFRETLLLEHFLGCPSPQRELLDETINQVLDGFFQVIHPGNLADYVPLRRRDSLVRHNCAHFRHGNQSLIDALTRECRAEIRTGCHVQGLYPENNGVRVRWLTKANSYDAWAGWIVLATPASEARKLTHGLDPAIRLPDGRQTGGGLESAASRFLERIRYGKGISVVLGFRDISLHPLSYVVCPQGPANTFVFHRPADLPNTIVVTAYLVAEQAQAHWEYSDLRLVDTVLPQLDSLMIGSFSREKLAFSDVCHWPEIGPIISNQSYMEFSQGCLWPADRIILAGDYTWWDRQQMPYGMQAAIASGHRAANLVCKDEPVPAFTCFMAKPLAITAISELTDHGPEFIRSVEDGAVAYYGLILKAKPDSDIEQYLISESEDCLWSYHYGYGITSLDSALVMEGLLLTGRYPHFLNRSAKQLIEKFYDAEEGGFGTIPLDRTARAPYWQGTDCNATAFCGWLLAQIAPQRYVEIVHKCADYLKRKQLVSGRWPGKWFPSSTIPVFYALRLLLSLTNDFSLSCERAHTWLKGEQRRDGSWSGSVIESAAAILALCVLGSSHERIRHGCEWLKSRETSFGWQEEPILHYWFEEGDRKIYYYSRDKGSITSAWARIALRETANLLGK